VLGEPVTEPAGIYGILPSGDRDGEKRFGQASIVMFGGEFNEFFGLSLMLLADTDEHSPGFEHGCGFGFAGIGPAQHFLRCDGISAAEPDQGFANDAAPIAVGGEGVQSARSIGCEVGQRDSEAGGDILSAVGGDHGQRITLELTVFGMFEVCVDAAEQGPPHHVFGDRGVDAIGEGRDAVCDTELLASAELTETHPWPFGHLAEDLAFDDAAAIIDTDDRIAGDD